MILRTLTFASLSLVSVLVFSEVVKKEKPKNLTAIVYKNPTAKNNILFIHGTPGSREAFSFYINNKDLRSVANMISVDRIGFGDFDTKAEARFEQHSASILKTATSIFGSEKIVCVGHSYGATLCLDLIASFPNYFEKAILIAGGFNPDRKILRWYNYLAASWPLKFLLPEDLTNSNKEMYGLKEELVKLEKKLENIKASVLIIHGFKDKIAPFDDSVWLLNKLKLNKVTARLKKYESDGHFIIWRQQEKVKDDILNQL